MSSEALKTAALRARLVDLDALALADLSQDDGSPERADALISKLRADKPFLFAKHAREMTPEEAAAKLAELRNGPKAEPMPTDKTAKQMSPCERAEFIREVSRRFG